MDEKQRSKQSAGNNAKEVRADYGWSMPISSRWADCDPYGHVNNAMYYNWIDTAVTTLAIERGILRAPGQTTIGLCVSSACQFLRPIGFPATVDACVRLGRIGDKSLRYEVALFAAGEDEPSAVADFTHVYVDRNTRTSVTLTEKQKAAMRDLLRADAA